MSRTCWGSHTLSPSMSSVTSGQVRATPSLLSVSCRRRPAEHLHSHWNEGRSGSSSGGRGTSHSRLFSAMVRVARSPSWSVSPWYPQVGLCLARFCRLGHRRDGGNAFSASIFQCRQAVASGASLSGWCRSRLSHSAVLWPECRPGLDLTRMSVASASREAATCSDAGSSAGPCVPTNRRRVSSSRVRAVGRRRARRASPSPRPAGVAHSPSGSQSASSGRCVAASSSTWVRPWSRQHSALSLNRS